MAHDVVEKIELAEGQQPCYDPECSGVAEVEQDGEDQWYECLECHYQFGWTQVRQTIQGACAIGVPEELRRVASAPMEAAMRKSSGGTVDLGSSIPMRSTDG